MAENFDHKHHKVENNHPKEGQDKHDPLANARLDAGGDKNMKSADSSIENMERLAKQHEADLTKSLQKIAQLCSGLDRCGIDSKQAVKDWADGMPKGAVHENLVQQVLKT